LFILRDIHIKVFADGFQDKIFDIIHIAPLLEANLSSLWPSGLNIIVIIT